ncbi:MAG: CxxxxCH/CxxCH domain-containing protein [Desulfuromonadales bacterium]|nr:CxxxxCH/CxxCH domain-containing protein [Desulfuromonadales bacterium]
MPGTGAVLTHPLLDATQLAAVEADPGKANDYQNMTGTLVNYDATNRYVNGALLTDGGVGCVSCHGAHYTDSNASTADGPGTFNAGDGLLLRGDGPLRSGATRNDTAQIRSNLCQSCHAIELHGQTTAMLGCLDCHGGHAYNGGSPNAYILRSQSSEPLPTRPGGVLGGDAPIIWESYAAGGSTRTKWADENEGTATGFCEQCHGDVNAPPLKGMAVEHEAGNSNECTACHKHNDPANVYSFNRDASAATCGQCHGFPPYLNVPGDRQLVPANDGGYAENNSADLGTPYDYLNDSGHFKNEEQTGHKVHAGADLSISPAGSGQWYFVGASGIDNCKVCHGPQAASTDGGHRIDPATRPETFRDLLFDGIAETGGMVPSYDFAATYTCSTVYCHTNGAPYNGASRPNRDFSSTHTTPPWAGDGSSYAAGGFGSIYSQADRCAKCHGNSVATMTTESNSVAHAAHIGGTTTLNMGIVLDCAVCHVNTAIDAVTLAAGAMDGRTGGEHVNGVIDVDFDTTALDGTLVASVYTAADGTCSTWCHNVTGDAGAFAADWDVVTDMQCDSCHGGLDADSSADGGYGPIASGSHTRHVSDANGPLLSCDECHGTNSTLGTHSGHLDGVFTMVTPVDTLNFSDICQECHGYEADAGEVLPVWGNAGTTDCATCHSGTLCGNDFNGHTVVTVEYARTTGHNRPAASGAFPESANIAANLACLDCHIADSPLHWDGANGDYLLRTDDGFPATYAGSENAYCGNCHGTSPGSVKAASAATQNINTHQSKLCVACHNVHGDQNIQMIWTARADQVSHDPSTTGKYAADVFFTNLTDFGLNSYDEDDGAAGGAGEANADDICATCHSVAAGTTHNNVDNSVVDHYQGTDCFTCHGGHDDTDAFKVGVGTACNDCHGFPPATGAHLLHSQSASPDKDVEDISDCAFCHTGADAYSYDLTADTGASLNHSNSAGRKTILATSVGYNATDLNCATACHTSTVANGGRWTDAIGLDCNACHSDAAGGSLSASHEEHLVAGKLCTDCHTLDDGATPVVGPLTHIDDTSGANEGAMYQGMTVALADEATVTRTNMTFDDPNNTCSGSGVAAGCHATGTPDWDVAIPPTAAGCISCHTDTTTAAYNPVSGLHGNATPPTVTGNAHDDSFDDGNTGTADCITCHTLSPSTVHINGALNSGAAITVAAIAGYSQANGTCATTCHSAGTVWAYKWATSAYNSDGSECANCHGDYANGWVTGVAPHTENPTRGSKHNNAGTLTYPCTDCHAIGSASGYNWTSQWDPTGTTSNHGDGFITMNQTAINTFAIDTVPNPDRAGCTTASCHGNDAAHNFTVTTTAFTTATVAGNEPSVLCSSCHGGTVGTNANGYWPDGTLEEDTAGAHAKHITALASEVYNETVAQLLTDNTTGNPTLTSDEKQKELCSYCHNTPGSDGDHGIVANLPAEVNSMFGMWTKAADNGVYDNVADTCATVDCHFNKTTPDNTFGWYDGNASACVMCHVDVTSDTAHTAHTGAATTFGISIACADCHDAATDWAGNTAPATGHLDNTYSVSGGVAFTYSANTCGTNACHEDGKGGAPADNTYTWGATLGDCSICHAASPTTDAHSVHIANGSYVPNSCNDCHAVATAGTHIDGAVTYGGEISAAPGNGSCTNTCHIAGDAGDWAGGTPALACTDCHSGSGASAYIGGDKSSMSGPNNMPQFGMHTVTATVSGVVHDHTIAGAGGDCAFCHVSMPAPGGSHVDGTLLADGPANTDRGMFAGFSDGTPPTCTTACHSAGTTWTYKWSATAANSDGSECANCHGDYTNGWNAGVGHALNATRGNSSAHNDTGNLSYECTACHVVGATTGNYPWASGSNDWATEGTTLHGDGNIDINNNTAVHVRSGTAGCTGCHAANDGSHDFPISAWTPNYVAGDSPAVGGGCNSCHSSGADPDYPDENWPGHLSTYPSRGGKHKEHVQAIAAAMPGGNTQANRNNSCNYCHLNPGEPGHNDNVSPSADFSIRHILNQAQVDPDPVINGGGTNYVTCSTIDCHFNNAVTPHWYTDNIAPAQVALTASLTDPAVEPRSIRLSWTSPGDDANVADTTVYRYDMRYGTSSAIASDFVRTDNYVGGLPLAYMQGTLQDVLVDSLTPGQTYYFSLRSQDVAGNWSSPSPVVSAVASGDTLKPYFNGVNRARKGDHSATINVEWSHAEDHTMPVTYNIWMKPAAAGALDMDVDAPTIIGFKGYKYQLTAADGVVNDMEHFIGVRACDGVTPTPNCDSNTEIVSVTPTNVPEVEVTNHAYVTSTGTTWEKDGLTGAGVVGANLPLVFASASNNTYDVTYFADTFAIYLDVGNSAATVRVEIGYSTNGSDFVSLGLFKDVVTGSRSDRVYQFKLADVAGKTIAIGQRLAVRLSEVTATGVKANYGTATFRGDLTVAERKVNLPPTDPALQATVNGALVNMTWTEATDTTDGVTDEVHYDLYGSDDNGATWKYLIATGLPATTTAYSWNTQMHGIALNGAANVAVKIEAGDGFAHTESSVNWLSVNNASDNVAPDAITDLVVKRRAKGGAVMLRWTAPGDDFENNGRATYYDVRYDTRQIIESGGDGISTVNFADATRFFGAPLPGFGGHIEEMEITGLEPLTPYYFAIKTYDEGGNASAISTPKSTTPTPSDQETGGPRCGMCHTTAPSVVESVGNHRIHGITVADCTRCHGSQVASFGLDHQDGVLLMGWSTNGPQQALIDGTRIYYTDDGTPAGNVLYDDPDGGGGFYNGNFNGIGDGIDDGTCMNFVAGCHGPAGSPGYQQPNWISTAKLDCANCHGDPNRTVGSFYGRDFDATIANGGIVPDQVKGAPPIDNHGLSTGKFVGQHEKHLNYSFRFAKGDSCNLCHPGRYSDKNDLDGKHGDGYIDVELYKVAAGDDAQWSPGTESTPGTCGNMSPDSCHPSTSTPTWDSAQSFECRECHGMGGKSLSHVTDPNGAGFVDDGLGNCEWCHFGGHPLDDVGGTSLILANSSQVGIDYRSGGIHLRKAIGGRSAVQTEAELCWSCHDSNGISEWGADNGSNNLSTRPPNAAIYNYGTVTGSNWTTATWSSAVTNFSYKTGAIQSTHSTNELGTSAVSGSMGSYAETVDAVADIRCSNCHDVHNLNKAPGDDMTGQPYLRGTWVSNPYPEDGAPWGKTYAAVVAIYGAVPRAGGNEMGGYQIDQNNDYPTAGLSLATSAGLCTLCHGTDVDNMDKTPGENLWIGSNGHSNAAIGGTASNAANIFGNGVGGRPTSAALQVVTGSYDATDIYTMGMQNPPLLGTTDWVYGYRNAQSKSPSYLPVIGASQPRAYNSFTWGVTIDDATIDVGYHAFTCSKCHNPHASRLPKLMITNCLDTRHNTWQSSAAGQGGGVQADWTTSTYDNGEQIATWNTAQNCHRYDPHDNVGGWNKVTPW